jgi:preprotein translocase subunit SecA
MVMKVFRRIFGAANERYLKKLAPLVTKINDLEKEVQNLSDDDLKARTDWFKKRYQEGESLDDLLPEAFATVREAAKRTLGQRHYDVQLIGGIVLHCGSVAEMKTGEGKTLVATLAVYLNALSGRGVHVVTVNDYLASRDAEWMGRIYTFLGLSVGTIVHGMGDAKRREAYAADITYATNNELGFDYLRDNMKMSLKDRVQRPFSYAIVDEVDCILIDEARTPLIISGPAEESSDLYEKVNQFIPQLEKEDFEKDEKGRSVTLTDSGMEKLERLSEKAGLLKGQHLYDLPNTSLVHHLNQALKAHKLFAKDVDYVIKAGQVVLVDEFTGRMTEGRRYSDGLHQALEAKEGVKIEIENQTLASITYQNFFRLYPKLAGMTGTAMTEAAELHEIYKLDVVAIPTNHPIQRKDLDDEVYRTFQEKITAIIKLIKEIHAKGQPILVGTVSIEKSEIFSEALRAQGIPHKVLNARHHDKEAFIIADAGIPGAITIATNMAGRGTDIQLGGNLKMRLDTRLSGMEDPEERAKITQEVESQIAKDKERVLESGGLFVIGTERHESRRIDNQLRGRSGRQGDPGCSKFFLALEDDELLQKFGLKKLSQQSTLLKWKEGEYLAHPWITRSFEKAQQKVEALNFDTRKHLLKYDDVMNDQRKVIYGRRDQVLSQDAIKEDCWDMCVRALNNVVEGIILPDTYPEDWDIKELDHELKRIFDISPPLDTWVKEEGMKQEILKERLLKAITKAYKEKEDAFGSKVMRLAEKTACLRFLDQHWKNNLYALDHLRQGVHLRAYAQKDPLNEYKREAFQLFEALLDDVDMEVAEFLFHFSVNPDEAEGALEAMLQEEDMSDLEEIHDFYSDQIAFNPQTASNTPLSAQEGGVKGILPPQARAESISRNAPCPCGSGKRYKNCHGKLG